MDIRQNLVFATLVGAVKALFENRILAAGLPSSAAKSPIKTFSTTPPESNPAHGPSKSAPRDPQALPESPQGPPGTFPSTPAEALGAPKAAHKPSKDTLKVL